MVFSSESIPFQRENESMVQQQKKNMRRKEKVGICIPKTKQHRYVN
jgi:hypothetical protein